MFNYTQDERIPSKITVRSGKSGQNYHGYFFKTPENNWFFQPDATREISYLELRRLYNKLYQLNRR
jgi:hypothetical protein